MSGVRVVLVTHPPRGAARFARRLVELRLAACVNRFPIRSSYRWRGKLEEGAEVQLVVKTTRARLRALEQHVRSAHPYDTPEFVVLEPERVGARYRSWLLGEVAVAAAGQARRGSAR